MSEAANMLRAATAQVVAQDLALRGLIAKLIEGESATAKTVISHMPPNTTQTTYAAASIDLLTQIVADNVGTRAVPTTVESQVIGVIEAIHGGGKLSPALPFFDSFDSFDLVEIDLELCNLFRARDLDQWLVTKRTTAPNATFEEVTRDLAAHITRQITP